MSSNHTSTPKLPDPNQLTSNAVRAKKLRAIEMGKCDADFLARNLANEFADRITSVNRQFENAVDLFGLSNCTCEALSALPNVAQVTRFEENDIAVALNSTTTGEIRSIDCDLHALADLKPDLVTCNLGLQQFSHLGEFLAKLNSVLPPDCLFMASMPAAGTLRELSDAILQAEAQLTGSAAARLDRFIEIRDAGGLLQQAGFALPVADGDAFTVRYDNVRALIEDLRAMGATSAREDTRLLPRGVLELTEKIYAEKFGDPDKRIRATFNFVLLTAWTPHESQQKPMKPGSAKHKLSDFL